MMVDLGKHWSGNITGTNTGKVFLELIQSGENLTGQAHIQDDGLGIVVYSLHGHSKGQSVTLQGTPLDMADGLVAGNVSIDAELTEDGRIVGTWKSTIGTAGMVYLHPQNQPPVDESKNLDAIAIQNRKTFGTVRLYLQDLKALASEIELAFESGKLAVAYSHNNEEITRLATKFFEEDAKNLAEIKKLRFFIQGPDLFGVQKQIIVELNADQENFVIAQGANRSWVNHTVKRLISAIKPFEKKHLELFKKWGLELNTVVFVAMLVVIPDIEKMDERVWFVLAIVALQLTYSRIHSHLVPIALINLAPKPPGFWTTNWPGIKAWLLNTVSLIVATLIAAFFTGFF